MRPSYTPLSLNENLLSLHSCAKRCTIDSLINFNYNGNQLTAVNDNGSSGYFYGDEEFVNNNSNQRAYDANGNMMHDASNCGIWAIGYNVLNLPNAIQFQLGHQTLYTYSAAGAKLKVVDKTAPTGVNLPVSSLDIILANPSVASTTTTDYVGNMIYQNGALQMILLPEGYIQGGIYYYYLKDHLGSNRVVMKSDGSVAESSNFYPSGMRFGESVASGGNVQPYRHIGKEMQSMHGLNWYDNGARMRQVDIPVWTTLDPLCEKYYAISPYAYCHNNFMNVIDPTGLTDYYVTPDGTISQKPDAERKIGNIKIRYISELPKSKPGGSDSFFAVDNKGNATGKSYTVKDGVSMQQYVGKGESEKGNPFAFNVNQINVSNYKDGKGLFEFMADNTHVEWSQFKLNNGQEILSTSHDNYADNSAPNIAQAHYGSILEYTHSHPVNGLTDINNISTPSGMYNPYKKTGTEDLGMTHWMNVQNTNAKTYIYVPMYGAYYQYNEGGTFKALLRTFKIP